MTGYNYALTFQINSDWGMLTVNTPGITIKILSGSDEKTTLNNLQLLWGKPGSGSYGKQIFGLVLNSRSQLNTLQVTTQHGWDQNTRGDCKGEITLTSHVEQHTDAWAHNSEATCLRHFPISLPGPLAFPTDE